MPRRMCMQSLEISRPSCWCFHLCSHGDLAHFRARLPIVASRQSPWYRYLTTVYGGAVPLPVDLSMFELVYPALLPVQPDCSAPLRGHECRNESTDSPPRCSEAECARWHMADPSKAGQSGMLRLQKLGSFILPTRSWAVRHGCLRYRLFPWNNNNASVRSWLSHWSRYWVLLQDGTRTATPATNAWLEVIRQAHNFEAGNSGYGCWFWRARGSGVFVNSGRGATFANRRAATVILAHNCSARREAALSSIGSDTTREWFSQLERHRHFNSGGACRGDAAWALGATAQAMDSLQVLWGNGFVAQSPTLSKLTKCATPLKCKTVGSLEVVLPPHRCQHHAFKTGCVVTVMRTGLHAERPCECKYSDNLNCATKLHPPLQAGRSRRTKQTWTGAITGSGGT